MENNFRLLYEKIDIFSFVKFIMNPELWNNNNDEQKQISNTLLELDENLTSNHKILKDNIKKLLKENIDANLLSEKLFELFIDHCGVEMELWSIYTILVQRKISKI